MERLASVNGADSGEGRVVESWRLTKMLISRKQEITKKKKEVEKNNNK